MGNLCGKQSKDAFDGPGRTLGSAPAPATKASVPASANAASTQYRTIGGPARPLGTSKPRGDPENQPPANVAAAEAAEVRTLKRCREKISARIHVIEL
jgi:hypothetical protein